MLTQKILDLPRGAKKILMLGTDLVLLPAVFWLSLSIALNEFVHGLSAHQLASLIITVAATMFVFVRMGLYRAVVRYMGPEILLAVFKGVSISSLIFLASVTLFSIGTPISAVLFYWTLSFFAVLSTRFLVRQLIYSRANKLKQRVIIYGAGKTGYQLLSTLTHGADYEVVAMLDDDKKLEKSIFHGVQVYNPRELPLLCKNKNVSQIFLAMPSLGHARRRQILEKLEKLEVRVRSVPNLSSLISGSSSVSQLQDINIEDLLGRDAVPPNEQLLTSCIKDKTVMVTGAGGSIGSELCRQIIKLSPNCLILFDICEYLLYQIEQELKLIQPGNVSIKIIALLGDVKDADKIQATLSAFKVDTIYHAAAYKHVPLVEHNIIEGVRNNIMGTLNIAKAAKDNSVETVVLVSTDKAVRPTNIMGATKRVAELILQAYATLPSATTYCMVRFGNVLGSSGSVVPLFCEQIKRGGPVTVTHEDIIRYFMTIPEAALLVIQAGTLAAGGDVFLLDMGEPVKIAELAKKLIRLSGLTPKDESNPLGDIEIQYTGLRPGEKLFEELLIDEGCSFTEHPRIMRAKEIFLPYDRLKSFITELEQACQEMNCNKIQSLLAEQNLGYTPNSEMADLIWQECSNKRPSEKNHHGVAKLALARIAKSAT